MRDQRGQSLVLLTAALLGIVLGALVLGGVARGIGARSDAQRAADLAALAGARAMLDAYPRLFVAPEDPDHLAKADYLGLGEAAALRVARANNEPAAAVSFPDADSLGPVRIAVEVRRRVEAGDAAAELAAEAEAELAPVGLDLGPSAAAGEYAGPFAVRQGKRMRPDVAAAFDRMAVAAAADGHQLLIASAYRSDAEQAVLWARNPDPKWVAPPGTSLHRLGTELDIGPPSAYAWLAANATRFHFVQRYAWEAWHYGYTLNARSSSSAPDDGDGRSAVPDFVPAQFAGAIAGAAQRYNVSATLLSAQLYAESGFNPFAVSPAGAQGIAQFMPGTAKAMGLADPFDADQAIDAQARLMRDLLRQFGSVSLALAAYNAGPGAVAACMCVPPYSETRGYVARILGLLGGAGDLSGGGLAIRLVR